MLYDFLEETMENKVLSSDWTCLVSQKTYKDYHGNGSEWERRGGEECPAPCYAHSTCEDCLASRGGEGGSQECIWSESLLEVGGVLGLGVLCPYHLVVQNG